MNMDSRDQELQQAVSRELSWDTRVSDADIAVGVHTGVVTLSGTVRSWAERLAAQKAAHRVAGVLDVANEIQVRIPEIGARSDTQIAHAVRHALEWDVFVPENRIQSTVANGCVTLTGDVDLLTQKDDAARAVRNLVGVTQVINDIEVQPRAGSTDVQRAIEAALERRAKREAARVDVETRDGHVTLTGIVHSRAEHDAIVGAAKGTRGVRSVEDKLCFVQPAPAFT
jgi:osmotically-inducible protein OsmY